MSIPECDTYDCAGKQSTGLLHLDWFESLFAQNKTNDTKRCRLFYWWRQQDSI